MSGLIIHEWAEASGGAEQVVDQFISEFPDADLRVLWNDAPNRFPHAHETWLARTPFRRSKALALPLMPVTWRFIPRHDDYDWMLVSSHLFAHHAKVRGNVQPPKFVYTHTPARYIWEPGLDMRGSSPGVRLASTLLKPLDKARAGEARSIAANSEFTRKRIQRVWDRDSRVIYPPVDVKGIVEVSDWTSELTERELEVLAGLPRTFLLGASRFVRYKHLDLVIEAGASNDIPVVIAGSGPDEDRLRDKALSVKVPVHFVDRPSTPMLRALYQSSLAYVFPAIEDFGIMPIEAMASGTPVIAQRVGGAAESVELTSGGVTFADTAPSSWREAVDAVLRIDRRLVRDAVSIFSAERFRQEIREWISP